jgi:hypothetical protein
MVPDVYVCVDMSDEAAMIIDLEVYTNTSYAAVRADMCLFMWWWMLACVKMERVVKRATLALVDDSEPGWRGHS